MKKKDILNGMSEEEFYKLYPTEEAYKMAMGGSLSGAPHNGQPTANQFFDFGAQPAGPQFFYPEGGPIEPVYGQPFVHNLGPGEQPFNQAQLDQYGLAAWSQDQDPSIFNTRGSYKVNPYVAPAQQSVVPKPKYPRVNTPEWDANQAAVKALRAEREAMFSGNLAMQKNGGAPCFDCGGYMEMGGYHTMPNGIVMADSAMKNGGSKKAFRAMIKKQTGGDTNAINDLNEDSYGQNITNNFMNTIKENTMIGIADEAAQQFDQQFAQMGMSMEQYGYNPNQANQQMFGDRYKMLGDQGKQAGQNFMGASMDMFNNTNPYMDYDMPKAGVGMDVDTKPASGTVNNYYYGSQGIPTPSNQMRYNSGFRNDYIPANFNPYMKWRTDNNQDVDFGKLKNSYLRDASVSNEYGAMDRFLSGRSKSGKHFFGPKKSTISMTFRTYFDPVTGEKKQEAVPVEDGQSQDPQKQLPAWAPPGMMLPPAQQPDTRAPWRIGQQPQQVQPRPHTNNGNWTDYFAQGGYIPEMQVGGTGPNGECTDQDKMNKFSPCFEQPGQTNYIENMGTAQEPAYATADELYSDDSPLNKNAMGVNDYFDTTISATGKRKWGIDGESAANWGIAGIAGLTSMAGGRERNDLKKKMQENTLSHNQFNVMDTGDKGKWNWTGMSTGMIDPYNTGKIVQQPGYGAYAMNGGQYQEGGEYEMDENEIQEFLRNGGTIQYLD